MATECMILIANTQACKPHCVASSIREALPWGRAKQWVQEHVDAAFDAASELSAADMLHHLRQAGGYAAARVQRAGREMASHLPRNGCAPGS